jgi:hypothetical protein
VLIATDDSTRSSSFSKWSLATIEHILKTRIACKPSRTQENIAVKSWMIPPSETSISPPVYFLPNQLERVTGWAFSFMHPRRKIEGGSIAHSVTRGFLLKLGPY